MVASVLAAELGGRDLADLVRVGDGSALGPLMEGVTARDRRPGPSRVWPGRADVRLRRLNYPAEVREAVFEQIRSERRRVAAATRAEGESQARAIRSAADRERSKAVAEAEADAARLVGEGEAAATRIANEAHAADPAFYQFLKTLDTYRSALDGRTTLVLSAESAFLKLLTQGLPEAEAAESPSPRPPTEPHASPASTSPPGRGPLRCGRRIGIGLGIARPRLPGHGPGGRRARTRWGSSGGSARSLREPWEPGLHWGLPWGLGRVDLRQGGPGPDPDRRRPGPERRAAEPVARPRGGRPPDRRPEPRGGRGDAPVPGGRPRRLPLRRRLGRRGAGRWRPSRP